MDAKGVLTVGPSKERDAGAAAARVLLVIEPGGAERDYWRNLWARRELLVVLAWRDVALRYRDTVIGIAWAVVRPFITMVVFTIVFSRLGRLPSEGAAPYPIMVFAGMLPWYLFSAILNDASHSIHLSGNLIDKVYFPRIIIPASKALAALVDFGINLLMLIILMIWYGFGLSWRVILLPGLATIAVLASFGPALLVTTLNVKHRDFRYVIPFIIQLGAYVSPVGYSTTMVPEQWRFWYSLNPMVSVIDGFRWCILGGKSTLYLLDFALSLGLVALFLLIGITYFRRTERAFADLI